AIKLVGVGEKITDLEPFHPDRMASRIIGMGDVLTLIEKAEAVYEGENAEDLAHSLAEGEFSLEDLRDQLRKVRKMGPLSSLLEMIPGMSAMGGSAPIDDGALGPTQAILDSMTKEERSRPAIINGSRKRRIARGSGTHVQDVNKLLKQHARMRKMMRSMSRKARRGGGVPGLPFPFR
ncbi:MAG: signal recognition particle protein, partial [Acidobacteriota bacterium]